MRASSKHLVATHLWRRCFSTTIHVSKCSSDSICSVCSVCCIECICSTPPLGGYPTREGLHSTRGVFIQLEGVVFQPLRCFFNSRGIYSTQGYSCNSGRPPLAGPRSEAGPFPDRPRLAVVPPPRPPPARQQPSPAPLIGLSVDLDALGA